MATTPPTGGTPNNNANISGLSKAEQILKQRWIATNKILASISDQEFRDMISSAAEYQAELNDIDEGLQDIADLFSLQKGNMAEVVAIAKTQITLQRQSVAAAVLAAKQQKDAAVQGTIAYRQADAAYKRQLQRQEELKAGASQFNSLLTRVNRSLRTSTELAEDYNDDILDTKKVTAEIKEVAGQLVELEHAKKNGNLDALGVKDEEYEAMKRILEKQKASLSILEEENRRIDKNVALYQLIPGIISKIPGLGSVLNFDEFEKKIRQAAQNGESVFKAAAKSIGGSFKDMLKDPMAMWSAGIGILTQLYKLGNEVNERVAKLGNDMGVSMEKAAGVYKYYERSATGFLSTYKDVAELASTMNDKLGTATVFSGKQLNNTVELKNTLGLTNDEAATLYQTGTKTVDVVYNQVNALQDQKGLRIDAKKLSKDVLGQEGLLRAQLAKNSGEFVKQAVAAAKVGSNIKEARDISRSFLDFESSIQAQMEAEVMTGKTINLDKARLLALQGKSGEALEEALGKNATLKDFNNMNVLQQESYAKALGMSVDQMGDILYKKEQMGKEGMAEVERLRKEHRDTEAAALEQQLMRGQSLKDAKETAEQQKVGERATEQMHELLLNMAEGVRPAVQFVNSAVGGFFKFVKEHEWIKGVLKTFGALAGIAGTLAAVGGAFKMAANLFKPGAKKPRGTDDDPVHVATTVAGPKAPKGALQKLSSKFQNSKFGQTAVGKFISGHLGLSKYKKPVAPGAMGPRAVATPAIKGGGTYTVGGGTFSTSNQGGTSSVSYGNTQENTTATSGANYTTLAGTQSKSVVTSQTNELTEKELTKSTKDGTASALKKFERSPSLGVTLDKDKSGNLQQLKTSSVESAKESTKEFAKSTDTVVKNTTKETSNIFSRGFKTLSATITETSKKVADSIKSKFKRESVEENKATTAVTNTIAQSKTTATETKEEKVSLAKQITAAKAATPGMTTPEALAQIKATGKSVISESTKGIQDITKTTNNTIQVTGNESLGKFKQASNTAIDVIKTSSTAEVTAAANAIKEVGTSATAEAVKDIKAAAEVKGGAGITTAGSPATAASTLTQAAAEAEAGAESEGAAPKKKGSKIGNFLRGKFEKSKLGKKFGKFGGKLGKYGGLLSAGMSMLGGGEEGGGAGSILSTVGGMMGGNAGGLMSMAGSMMGGGEGESGEENVAAPSVATSGGGGMTMPTPSKAPTPSPTTAALKTGGGGGFFSKLLGRGEKAAGKAGGGVLGKVGGFLGRAWKGVKGVASNLNPGKALGGLFKGEGLKKILGKIPKIGTLISLATTAYSLYQGGKGASEAAKQGASYKDVGSQVLSSILDLGGTVIGSMIGGPIGGMVAGWGLSKLGGLITENVDLSGLGKTVVGLFGGKGKDGEKGVAASVDGVTPMAVDPTTNNYSTLAGPSANVTKLAEGGLVTSTGMAKVDKGEVYLGANSITVLQDMLNSLKEQNKLLLQLVAKDTTVHMDGQKVGNLVARNVATTAGNLLNPSSRTYK